MEGPAIESGSLTARLSALARQIHSGGRLAETLQAVAAATVEHAGFGVAAVNLGLPGGGYRTVAVSGSQECSDQLLGQTLSEDGMAELLVGSEAWGALQFVPHGVVRPNTLTTWRPDLEPSDDPEAWHPDDALFAPMTGPDGEILGLLSVDLPAGGRRPDALQREVLELLAMQAGLAIAGSRMREELGREHERLLAEQSRLQASEEAFRFCFEGSATGTALVGLNGVDRGRYLRVNAALCSLLGSTETEMVGAPVERWSSEDNAEVARAAVKDAASGMGLPRRADQRCRRSDGSDIWLSLTSTVIGGDAAEQMFLLVQVEDVGARVARDRLLQHEAGHDPLTALPNRRLLLQRLEEALTRDERPGSSTTVLFCDLDEFKAVNDVHGHRTGDAVLEEIAVRLTRTVRSRDTVARLGGDEFVVLAEDLDGPGVTALCDRLRAAVGHPLTFPPGVRLGMSIGVVTVPGGVRSAGDAMDALTVLARGDEAMYRDKGRRRTDRAAG